jgi:hypothetical protein
MKSVLTLWPVVVDRLNIDDTVESVLVGGDERRVRGVLHPAVRVLVVVGVLADDVCKSL